MGIYEGDDTRMVDAAVAEEHAARAGLRVDAENVLLVRKAILEEYLELKATLDRERIDPLMRAYVYGDDPVSADAAVAFPERVSKLITDCHQQVNDLLAIANNLELAARSYGKTEDEIIAMTPAM